MPGQRQEFQRAGRADALPWRRPSGMLLLNGDAQLCFSAC
jgi:hypothetical protein